MGSELGCGILIDLLEISGTAVSGAVELVIIEVDMTQGWRGSKSNGGSDCVANAGEQTIAASQWSEEDHR